MKVTGDDVKTKSKLSDAMMGEGEQAATLIDNSDVESLRSEASARNMTTQESSKQTAEVSTS